MENDRSWLLSVLRDSEVYSRIRPENGTRVVQVYGRYFRDRKQVWIFFCEGIDISWRAFRGRWDRWEDGDYGELITQITEDRNLWGTHYERRKPSAFEKS